jgi:hypothetical protein
MKAIAKKTCHMEGSPDDIWIIKGNVYNLELLYRFIDEEGDEHFIPFEDFDEFFKKKD